MNERACVSCVLGIVVQLRCFSVLFGASLCIWSAVESIENIVSPEGGFLLARESGWKPYVHACYKRALVGVAKRACMDRVHIYSCNTLDPLQLRKWGCDKRQWAGK